MFNKFKMVEKEIRRAGEIMPIRLGIGRMLDHILKDLYEFEREFFGRWPRLRFPEFHEEFWDIKTAELPVDVVDRGDKFEVIVDIPGIPKENLEVNVTNDRVEIKGKLEERKKEEGGNYIMHERRATCFYRCIPLPEEIISDKATAKMREGILEISLPKKKPTEEYKVRKIKIE